MTRETKIGLLVGLAFIIVIGILLSDHLTSSTEPTPAQLSHVGDNTYRSTATPGGAEPPIRVVNAPAVEPRSAVPTVNDLRPRPNPGSIVIAVGPTGDNATPAGSSDLSPTPNNRQAEIPPPATAVNNVYAPGNNVVSPAPAGSQNRVDPRLAAAAGAHNEALVVPGTNEALGGGTSTPNDLGLRGNTPAAGGNAVAPTASKTYTVVPGDTLTKIAVKTLGNSKNATLAAIIAANPALKDDPDKVIVGQTYVIPSGATPASSAPRATPAPAPAAAIPDTTPVAPVATRKPESREVGSFYYTVKSGDNLSKIAREHCGGVDAVPALQELNQSVLKGDDKTVVVVGSKLKLPSRS